MPDYGIKGRRKGKKIKERRGGEGAKEGKREGGGGEGVRKEERKESFLFDLGFFNVFPVLLR